jgi:hypothetical protein
VDLHAGVDAGEQGGTPGTLEWVMEPHTLVSASGRLRPRRRVALHAAFAGAARPRIVVDLAGLTQVSGPSGIGCVAGDGCPAAP